MKNIHSSQVEGTYEKRNYTKSAGSLNLKFGTCAALNLKWFKMQRNEEESIRRIMEKKEQNQFVAHSWQLTEHDYGFEWQTKEKIPFIGIVILLLFRFVVFLLCKRFI